VRIYKAYGNEAVRVITENPYRLARDILGIGFRTADEIAAKVGIEKTALARVRAGISYALSEAVSEGHCGLPVEELTALAASLLDVPDELIAMAWHLSWKPARWSPTCWTVVSACSSRVCTERSRPLRNACGFWRRRRRPGGRIDAAKAIPWVERRTGLRLATASGRQSGLPSRARCW
jgi:exodeoxyribonuclease V alpha subunit